MFAHVLSCVGLGDVLNSLLRFLLHSKRIGRELAYFIEQRRALLLASVGEYGKCQGVDAFWRRLIRHKMDFCSIIFCHLHSPLSLRTFRLVTIRHPAFRGGKLGPKDNPCKRVCFADGRSGRCS